MPGRPAPGRLGAVIKVDELTERHGGTTAVDRLSFSVRPGRVTGCPGPHGAGRTSTLRMVLGLDAPTAGTATAGGVPFRSHPRGLRHVGALLDTHQVHGGRSAVAHLPALARGNGIPLCRVDEVLPEVGPVRRCGARTGVVAGAPQAAEPAELLTAAGAPMEPEAPATSGRIAVTGLPAGRIGALALEDVAPVRAPAGPRLGVLIRHSAGTMVTTAMTLLMLLLFFSTSRRWSADVSASTVASAWRRPVQNRGAGSRQPRVLAHRGRLPAGLRAVVAGRDRSRAGGRAPPRRPSGLPGEDGGGRYPWSSRRPCGVVSRRLGRHPERGRPVRRELRRLVHLPGVLCLHMVEHWCSSGRHADGRSPSVRVRAIRRCESPAMDIPRMGVPEKLADRMSMAEQHEYLRSRFSRRRMLRTGAITVGALAVGGTLGTGSAAAAPCRRRPPPRTASTARWSPRSAVTSPSAPSRTPSSGSPGRSRPR